MCSSLLKNWRLTKSLIFSLQKNTRKCEYTLAWLFAQHISSFLFSKFSDCLFWVYVVKYTRGYSLQNSFSVVLCLVLFVSSIRLFRLTDLTYFTTSIQLSLQLRTTFVRAFCVGMSQASLCDIRNPDTRVTLPFISSTCNTILQMLFPQSGAGTPRDPRRFKHQTLNQTQRLISREFSQLNV